MGMNQQQEQDMLNTLMEQRQDNNIMREYMMKKLRDSSRMNNMYTLGRMHLHQRNNNMERHMSNMEQHRQGLGKREAEPSFEYDVVAEHDANRDMHNKRQMLQNNQQMMTLRKTPQQEMLNTIMLRPAQQTYRMTQMDDNMESRMNQMNFLQASQQDNRMDRNRMNNQMNNLMQYNMDNRMDSRMNNVNHMDMNNMMNSRQMTTQHRNLDNQRMNYNMESRMNMNQMDNHRMQMNNMMNNRNNNQMMEMNNNMNQGRMH